MTMLTLHRLPRITDMSIGSRWGKAYAQFSKEADLGILMLVEHVVRELFDGSTYRVNIGLVAFGRRVIVRNNSLLLYATPRDGTGLANTSRLPPLLSRRSRLADSLVREIANAAQSLSESDDCPYFGNDTPPMTATPNDNGWLRCPNCNWRFNVNDRDDWTGNRHVRCGQRLEMVDKNA